MDGYRGLVCCWAIMVIATGNGCAWLQRAPTPSALGPVVLPPSPSLAQIVDAVNRNSSQIQSVYTNQATLTGQGLPTLRASVAFQRPLDLRLRADTALTGGELDLGSNQELFWIWVRRNQPPAMYYARHDQFAASPARRAIHIEPAWLIEALGVPEFDPALPHEGPYPAASGQLQIRTIRQTPEGPISKITVVEPQRALVLGQFIYDHRGQLRASAVTSQHRRDPLTGLIMPRVVDVTCPAANFSLRLDLGNATINQLPADPGQLFALPSYEGYPLVDLCNPNLPMSQMQRMMPAQPASHRPAPTSSRSQFPWPNWGRVLR